MEWTVEYTDEFETWWGQLPEDEQVDLSSLQRFGPALRRPHSGAISGSKHSQMKELFVQNAGRPYRVLYAFDPRRCAILLIGGDQTGDDRWYETFVPFADRIFDGHLATLAKQDLTDG